MSERIKQLYKEYKNIPTATKAALWFVFCSILQKCISFITVPIFTRLMPTEEYGIYSTYLSWYSILTVICTLNLHNCVYINGVTRAETEEEKDAVAIPLLSLAATITVICFAIYLIFHQWFNQWMKLPTIIVCLIFVQILFEPPVLFWSIKQRFEYKYISLVICTIAMVVCNSGLGIIFVTLADRNESVARVISIVLVQIIFGGWFYLYFFKRGKKLFSTENWKHSLSVSLPLVPHGLSLSILSSSDRILIMSLIGASEAAIYSVAYSAGFVVNVLKNSIVDALRPWIYEKIKQKQFVEIREKTKPILIIVMAITFLFVAFAPEIIAVMAPKEYQDAIYVIPPVAASSFFTFLYNMFSAVSFYFEKTKKIMYASVSGAIINLILNFLFIPKFGYIAAAYTTLFSYMFFSVCHYLIMYKVCQEELNNVKIFDVKFIFILGILAILITIGFSFTYGNLYVRYTIIIVMIVAMIINRKMIKSAFAVIKK